MRRAAHNVGAGAATAAMLVGLLGLGLAPPAFAAGWPWPVVGEVITPYDYGADPYAAGQHRGIDIAAPVGDTVRAATAGTVRFAGTAGSSGLTVSIRTRDGRFDTSYLHFESLAVSEGDRVQPGSELGAVGTTGSRSADEPHLHFGVRVAGERHHYRDPLWLLSPDGAPGPEPPGAAPPAALPVPATSPGPAPAPGSGPQPAPRPLPGPGGLAAPAPAGGPAAHGPAPEPTPRPSSERPAGGFDVGWVVAWAGVVVAALAAGGSRRNQAPRCRAGGRGSRRTKRPAAARSRLAARRALAGRGPDTASATGPASQRS